jgi:hypothetical protein
MEQNESLGLKVEGDVSTLTEQNRTLRTPLKWVDLDGY